MVGAFNFVPRLRGSFAIPAIISKSRRKQHEFQGIFHLTGRFRILRSIRCGRQCSGHNIRPTRVQPATGFDPVAMIQQHRTPGDAGSVIAAVGPLLDLVRDAGIAIADLATREADLEDVFLRLTGQRPQSEAATA